MAKDETGEEARTEVYTTLLPVFEADALTRPDIYRRAKEELGWTNKQMDAALKQMETTRAEMDLEKNGSRAIDSLNADWFLLKSENKSRICQMVDQPLNGHTRIALRSLDKQTFEMEMANVPAVGRTPAAAYWLTHPNRREYSGVFLDPTGPAEKDGRLNLWAGMGREHRKGDPKPFLDFIRDVIASKDAKVAEYVLNWLAWVVQNPTGRVGVVLCMTGEQGVGKGFLGNFMRSLFGTHGVRVGHAKHLTGEFNKHLLNACFVFCDEALFAASGQQADQLKGLVTEPTMPITAKFQDVMECDNYLSILMATNHEWAVNAAISDRRFQVIEVSEERQRDKAYFGKLGKWLDAGGAEVVHDYLRNRNVRNWDAENDRVMTEVYFHQKLASLREDWRWWRLCIDNRDFTDAIYNVASTGSPIPKSAIYRTYAGWHRSNYRTVPVDPAIFWRNFFKWCPDTVPRRQTQGGVHGKGQVPVIAMPSWDELSQALQKRLLGM